MIMCLANDNAYANQVESKYNKSIIIIIKIMILFWCFCLLNTKIKKKVGVILRLLMLTIL